MQCRTSFDWGYVFRFSVTLGVAGPTQREGPAHSADVLGLGLTAPTAARGLPLTVFEEHIDSSPAYQILSSPRKVTFTSPKPKRPGGRTSAQFKVLRGKLRKESGDVQVSFSPTMVDFSHGLLQVLAPRSSIFSFEFRPSGILRRSKFWSFAPRVCVGHLSPFRLSTCLARPRPLRVPDVGGLSGLAAALMSRSPASTLGAPPAQARQGTLSDWFARRPLCRKRSREEVRAHMERLAQSCEPGAGGAQRGPSAEPEPGPVRPGRRRRRPPGAAAGDAPRARRRRVGGE